MRRNLPLALAFILGFVMIFQYFIPHPLSQKFYDIFIQQWLIIISIFFYILSWRSFVLYHTNKIRRKKEGWWASIVAIVSFLFMALAGIITKKGYIFNQMYNYVYAPLQATMFSLLAFFVASAAFRAFRARNLEATLLLIAATIVMLGRVSVGSYIWKGLPDFVEWILEYPNMAAQRGIRIGVGLGMIATSLKIILGIERTYLGGGD
uniref:Uncharacterized protein n=1 Tax=candidate division WOR-3 bacterium TaxID=2052148 RepID=A0A7C4UB98_UNCW3